MEWWWWEGRDGKGYKSVDFGKVGVRNEWCVKGGVEDQCHRCHASRHPSGVQESTNFARHPLSPAADPRMFKPFSFRANVRHKCRRTLTK